MKRNHTSIFTFDIHKKKQKAFLSPDKIITYPTQKLIKFIVNPICYIKTQFRLIFEDHFNSLGYLLFLALFDFKATIKIQMIKMWAVWESHVKSLFYDVCVPSQTHFKTFERTNQFMMSIRYLNHSINVWQNNIIILTNNLMIVPLLLFNSHVAVSDFIVFVIIL